MALSSSDISQCRRCGARIVWTLTARNGRSQPVDAAPDPSGNLAVIKGGDGRVYSRGLTRAHPEPRPGEWRAMPHHATCPSYTRPPRQAPREAPRQGVRPVPWRQR
ncbi:hypothetical protein ACRAR1_06965 [Streptomyces sanyensis]|uniref:hypothetical protein n=1 Tax=Streptomyces sanyensis TaxID=568869 RepID=UPI003D76AA10